MMISDKDKETINDMITEAEKKSDSELVPMLVHKSDNYPAAHFRAAIIMSFLFSLALYFSPLKILNPIYFLWIQIPGLLVGYYLGNIPAITRLLITRQEVEYEVAQRAIEAFFHHNLHTTEKHNGVLIFISMMERKIKIITDVGVRKNIDQKVWDEIIFDFTEKIQAKNLAEALMGAIEASSNVLENYFPRDPNSVKKNELKNEIIIE